ncbi:hypothetical protein NLG97_g6292 [Lecanicillium saksenae]|uniref:Uncharacterized protein n=1 Tax=Lecanicillium saksenae TaxID=468837 RepID=A0ACC1QQ19_9HYPO|nr:hypothetical protein NLG97_g6292 [Lecanicillium saksenae]
MIVGLTSGLLSLLHAFRTLFPLPILILNSVFLGFMNAHSVPVGQHLLIAEIFAALEAFIIGSYAFIASVYQAGAGHCQSYLDTPFGNVTSGHGLPGFQTACGMQTAIFALAIIVMQVYPVVSVGCLLAHIGVAVAARKDPLMKEVRTISMNSPITAFG